MQGSGNEYYSPIYRLYIAVIVCTTPGNEWDSSHCQAALPTHDMMYSMHCCSNQNHIIHRHKWKFNNSGSGPSYQIEFVMATNASKSRVSPVYS